MAQKARQKRADADVKMRVVGLVWKPASQLLANPANWRRHPGAQRDALRGIFSEVGFAGSLLENLTTGHLIDGHARAEEMLTIDEHQPLPVVQVEMSEAEELKLLGVFDPIGAMATADKDQLGELLRSVETEDAALRALMAGLAKQNGLEFGAVESGAGGDEFDATPAEGEPITKPGDLWLIDGGRHRVLCGDSTLVVDIERLMGDECAAVVVTDPPYSVGYVDKARDMNARGYGHSRATLRAAIAGDEIDEEQAEQLWRGAFGVAVEVAAKPNAAWYVWHAQGRATRSLLNVMAELGFLHHQTLIWIKNNFVIGRCDYQWKHEPCFYGWQQGSRPDFYGAKNQTTVWQIDRDPSPEHPTQKPIALFEPPVLNHSAEGEIVFDCFAGSGPVLIAAHRNRRRAFLCEVSPVNVDVILRRAEAEGLSVERAA